VPGLSTALRQRLRVMFRLLTRVSPSLAARLALKLFITPRARPLSAEDGDFLRAARSIQLSLPSGRVHAYEWGGQGPAVLIVHGWISHAARLHDIISACSAAGFRVVAFDGPAHGRSSGQQADLHSFQHALDAVSAACAPIGAVLAHSFGALATALWLAKQPRAELRAAVLVAMPRDAGYMFEAFTSALALRPAVIARMRTLFDQRYGAQPEAYSALAVAARINVPVLFVHGEADEFIPVEHSLQMHALLPGSQLLRLAALNHSAPLRDAAAIHVMQQFVAARLRG
jgi:pimeloyl-ACP methyl ester carboxylesterase